MEYKILSQVNSPKDLKALPQESLLPLADEIRAFLCEKVSKTGGHLASNLGAVELTLAIHRVFDSPRDHIIFDVGHQSYVHKLLTGRKDAFDTLRTPGGISGFTKRAESEHDPFGAGHASTSVSAGLGFAEADRISGSDAYTVVVLGDGAYTGGLVHEALNNCRKKLHLIIILNENEMSISRTTGSFAHQMTRLRASKGYYRTKRHIANALLSLPLLGRPIYNFISRVKTAVKRAVYGANYFEELGLTYLGPVDGNDEEKLERLLREAKLTGQATIVHVKTKKGKGYAPAENSPALYHGIPAAGSPAIDNFSEVAGATLCAIAEKDKRVCAVTAAMAEGTGLVDFRSRFPDRFFDVGIAEGHAVTFSAGLSAQGLLPVFAVYSTFLQRAYDNLLHDVALQGLSLTLLVDRASLACSDGPTHHGIYDVALLNTIPGTVIYAPSTFESLKSAMEEAISAPGIKAIRYPNSGELPIGTLTRDGFFLYDIPEDAQSVVITYGSEIKEVLAARENASFGIIMLEKLCPYEQTAEKIRSFLPKGTKKIIFAEEGAAHGGAGEALRPLLSDYDYRTLAITDLAPGKKDTDFRASCGIGRGDILSALSD